MRMTSCYVSGPNLDVISGLERAAGKLNKWAADLWTCGKRGSLTSGNQDWKESNYKHQRLHSI